MYIISKFHDYYDTVLKQGIDKTILYKRDMVKSVSVYKEDFLKFQNIPDNYNRLFSDCSLVQLIPFVVGYCGKFKLGYEAVALYPVLKKTFLYSADEIEQFLIDTDTIKYFKKFYDTQNKNKFSWYCSFKKQNLVSAFVYVDSYTNNDVFVNTNAPLILFSSKLFKISNKDDSKHGVNIIINPKLNEYNFSKVVDPYSMFQEISMFIGGVLGTGQPEIVNISDKELAVKKGFDNQSFKTISPGKKYNRRK